MTIPSTTDITSGPSTTPYVAPPALNPTTTLAPATTGTHYGAALPVFTDIAWTLSQTNPWYFYG